MTSLTGAAGEDFASILRSLGYRMDRKPKPVEATPAEAATESKPVEEAAAPETAAVSAEPVAEAPVADAVSEVAPVRVTSSRSLLPDTDFFPGAPASVAPSAPVAEPAQEIAQEPAQELAPAVEAAATESAAPETAAAAPAEPEMIEVWRPAGRAERKPHHARRPRHQRRPEQAGQAEAPAADQAAQPVAEGAAEQKPGQRPGRRPDGEKRADRQERNQGRHDRQQRQEWQKKRDERNQRDDRPRRRDRGAPVDRADREAYYAKPGLKIRHNKEADPNSPFAKLAALKQQLEDGAKERRPIASASTSGFGMRAWYAPAARRPRWSRPATSASTVPVLSRRAMFFVPTTWSPWRSIVR
jgi:ATP-dependent RNA helicase SUPV3L1/SUV3